METEEDRYEARWLVAGYAAKQPPWESLWQQIVDEMIREAYLYLEIINTLKEPA